MIICFHWCLGVGIRFETNEDTCSIRGSSLNSFVFILSLGRDNVFNGYKIQTVIYNLK